MKVRFPRIRAKQSDARGFTSWRRPYRLLECCDCGLVHEFQYKVVAGKVAYRIRRANGYTRQQRKARGITR